MVKKFIRRVWRNYSKLGKRRKKKQVWRRPTGRDNKMRERVKGVPAVVSIGYKTDKKSLGKINEKVPMRVENLADLKKIGKENIAVLGKVGKKNKIAIAKKAKEAKIEFSNFNVEKFLKEINKKSKENKK